MSQILVYDIYGEEIKQLYQWDINQKIVIKGLSLSPAPAFHFANRENEIAYVVTPTVSGSDLICNVPNILLTRGDPIICYLYQENDTDAYKTIYAVRIPVICRAKPDDYEYSDNVDYESIASLNAKVNGVIAELEQVNLDKNVRVDIIQDFSDEEKVQGRANIGAATTEGVYETANSVSYINNTDEGFIKNLVINGHSIQEGTPTPEAPVAIQSVEEIRVKVGGKNLSDKKSITPTASGALNTSTATIYNGAPLKTGVKYCFSADVVAEITASHGMNFRYFRADGTYVSTYHANILPGTPRYISYFTPNEDFVRIAIYATIAEASNVVVLDNIQLEISAEPTPYEPYISESHTIVPPQPLNAVGEYVDRANVAAGVWEYKTHKGGEEVFTTLARSNTSAGSFYANDTQISPRPLSPNAQDVPMLCNLAHYVSYRTNPENYIYGTFANSDTNFSFWLRNGTYASAAEVREYIISLGFEWVYPLATPITIPMTDEELALFRSLKTHAGSTTISITDQDGNDISYMFDYLPLINGQSQHVVDLEYLEKNIDIKLQITKTQTAKDYISDLWVDHKTEVITVGTYVIHNNALWRCLVQHTGIEPVEGTYWKSCTIANELSQANAIREYTVQSGVHLYRMGNVVIFYIQDGRFTGEADTPFLTLPVGYRPAALMDIKDTSAGARFIIRRTGEILNKSTYTNVYIRFSVTYVTTDPMPD